MRIGVFDSGLGGLLVLRGLRRRLPDHDFFYLGDTQRVPYGNRSQDAIYRFTEEAVAYLFRQGCALVVIACNTASTRALRRIQREFLPKRHPDRRVLGVVIPTVEAAANGRRVGVLATAATVASGAFVKEFRKLDPGIRVYQQAAPLLVPLIENGGLRWAEPILASYLRPLLRRKIDTLVLGCTHYPRLRRQIRRQAGAGVRVVAQDELLPAKLEAYLRRHPEIERVLSKKGRTVLAVTDRTPTYGRLARAWFGTDARLRRVTLDRPDKGNGRAAGPRSASRA